MFNLWERQNAMKALYSKCVGTICNRHEMTRMELDILSSISVKVTGIFFDKTSGRERISAKRICIG